MGSSAGRRSRVVSSLLVSYKNYSFVVILDFFFSKFVNLILKNKIYNIKTVPITNRSQAKPKGIVKEKKTHKVLRSSIAKWVQFNCYCLFQERKHWRWFNSFTYVFVLCECVESCGVGGFVGNGDITPKSRSLWIHSLRANDITQPI